MKDRTRFWLKIAGVFLAGVITGAVLKHLALRFDVVYIGLDGIGYLDHVTKASFFRSW